VLAQTTKFIDKEQQEGKPWFVWFQHYPYAHPYPSQAGVAGQDGVGKPPRTAWSSMMVTSANC